MTDSSSPRPLDPTFAAAWSDVDERAGDEAPRFTWRHGAWLAAITLLAAALRLWNLGEWSFWVDEAHTYRDATMPLRGEGGLLETDRALYPLTFLGLRVLLAMGWVGDDEFSLRLPFALLGIASVPLLAVCGRRLVGPTPAVAAALLCAVHPWHVYWSQNARGYVLVFLASIVVLAATVRWVQLQRTRDLVLAAAALVVGTASHPTGAFAGIGLVLFLLLRPFALADGRRLLTIAALAVVAVVIASVAFARFSPFGEFRDSKGDTSIVHLLQTVAYYFRPPLLLASLAGLVLCGLRWSTLRGLLVTCLLLAPFVVLLAIGGVLVKATARYVYCTLPLWLLLAGRVCVPWLLTSASDWRRAGREQLLPALAVVCIVGADLVTEVVGYHGDQHGQRARWRQACAFATDYRESRDAAGLRMVTIGEPIARFYLQRHGWEPDGLRRYPGVEVRSLESWHIHPGGREHLRGFVSEAQAENMALVVCVTRPELAEKDADGAVWRTLVDEFELALYLPCWVGPKEENLFVFVPRQEDR